MQAHGQQWGLGRRSKSDKKFHAIDGATERLYERYPKTQTDTALLDFISTMNLRRPHVGRRVPDIADKVTEALFWMEPRSIEVHFDPLDLRQKLRTNLFDTFTRSPVHRGLLPQVLPGEQWMEGIKDILPFMDRLHSQRQADFLETFRRLGPEYEVSHFGFIAFEAWVLLRAPEGARPHLFTHLFDLFHLGIHMPGVTADGTVLVLAM